MSNADAKMRKMKKTFNHHLQSNAIGRSPENHDTKRNLKGETKLHLACIAGNTERVRKLLELKHSPKVRDYCGWTPLHEAANRGYVEIAKLLIKSGANVNDPGGSECKGVTPMHDAASWGHFSMMSLLHDNGADFAAKTETGETVLDCLEDWRKRSADLTSDEEVEYANMLPKLSAAIRQSTKKFLPPRSPRQNALTDATYNDETSTGDIAPGSISTDEDHRQTVDNVEDSSGSSGTSTRRIPMVAGKLQSALVDCVEMIDDRHDNDRNYQAQEDNLVDERSFLRSSKRKSIDDRPKNNKHFKHSNSVPVSDLAKNVLLPLAHGSKRSMEACSLVPLNDRERENERLEAPALNHEIIYVEESDQLDETEDIKKKLDGSNVVGVEDTWNRENKLECVSIGNEIRLEDLSDVGAETRKRDGSVRRKTSKSPSSNYDIVINAKGETKLHVACIAGNIEEVTKLLESNHPPEIRDYCGWTPLHEAANRGYVKIAELLIEAGANVNDPGGPMCGSVTPLHVAASGGYFATMCLLIENGANLQAETRHGETILNCFEIWASQHSEDLSPKDRLMYESLHSRLSNVSREGAEESSLPGQRNTLENLTIRNETLTDVCASQILSADEDHGRITDGVTCHSRSNRRNRRGESLGHHSKHHETERPANNDDTKRNLKGETKLHLACIAGNTERVRKLLELKHSPKVRDYCGWTPLHEAANRGYVEIAKLLIKSGANVNDPGGSECKGVTPMHDAASCGHLSMMLLLHDNGADFAAKTKTGETVLDCLKDWRRRTKNLTSKKEVMYKNMLSKLSAAIQ